MGTTGIVTVQSNQGEVLLKIVAGCNGFNARDLAKELKKRWPIHIDQAQEIARDVKFGCRDCLVVMTAEDFRAEEDEEPRGYRETFNQPRIDPVTKKKPQHTRVITV